MRRRQAVTRKAMVAEGNETQSKQKAQHTKEEIKALENFMRLRFGMTPTAISSVWRKYGTAQIARMAQEVYEEDIATAMQIKAETQAADLIKQHAIDRANIANAQEKRLQALSAQWWHPGKAQTQEEELLITERKQHSTIEEKRSEEIAATTTGEIAATTTGSTKILVTTGPTQHGATIKAHTQPEEELTTKKQQKSEPDNMQT